MTVTICEWCAQPLGAPHLALPSDCILGHTDHALRYIGYLCKRHYHGIDDRLGQILELFALSDDVLLPGPGGDERRGTRFGSPAPGNLDLMAITDRRNKDWHDDPEALPDVPGTLLSWCRLVDEELPEDPAREHPALTLSAAVGYLRRWRHYIAQQAWVDDYVADLTVLHRVLAGATRAGMWPQSLGKCPNCPAKLYPTVGEDVVTCDRCRSTWSGVDLARLRLILEQEVAG